MKRNYMCTINFDQKINPLKVLPNFTVYRGIKRATFQLEKGDKNGRLHWQIFLEFEYPLPAKSIIKDTQEQGLKMHVDDNVSNKHPKAGRNYVTKGDVIDGHRYTWIKESGWIGKKPEIIKEGFAVAPPKCETDTKAHIMEWLKWGIKMTQEQIKSVDREKVKII